MIRFPANLFFFFNISSSIHFTYAVHSIFSYDSTYFTKLIEDSFFCHFWRSPNREQNIFKEKDVY